MKEIIDIHGFKDVIIYSELIPQLIRDEDKKVITKQGDIISHIKIPKLVSLYFDKYDANGCRIGVETIEISADSVISIYNKIMNIKREEPIITEYYSDDLPF